MVRRWSTVRIRQRALQKRRKPALFRFSVQVDNLRRRGKDRRAREDTRRRAYSVGGVTRFVIDCETLLRIAAGEIEVAAEHQLVAPTLIRSQALAALYEAARRGEISAAEGIDRVTRINSLKVRFLGDKVLQRNAWKVADQLEWETTYDAEFVALTQLQADIFVTSDVDLARAVSGLVETATIDALGSA
jgi:predicted nucleic acid-binding protein